METFISKYGLQGVAILTNIGTIAGFKEQKAILSKAGYLIQYAGNNVPYYKLTAKGECMVSKIYKALESVQEPVEVVTYE